VKTSSVTTQILRSARENFDPLWQGKIGGLRRGAIRLNGCGREWKYIISQFHRVRFVVRCFACLLLITAICFGYKILKEGKPLVVRKDAEVKVIPVDFNDNVGVKLDGITAKQAQELLEQAEKQKAPPTPAK
jgi:hypothetical protein